MLVNREPGEEIIHQRGLCQGNPLSPMIFIFLMDKRRRGFIWKGQEQDNGGNCLVPWQKGFKDVSSIAGWASMHMCLMLRVGWLARKKTDPTKPCTGFQIQVHQDELCERDSVGWRSLVAPQQPGFNPPQGWIRGWAAKNPPCWQQIWVCTVRVQVQGVSRLGEGWVSSS